ncbi:MAG: DEAD/DEAH box helicase [Aquificae bacterium]|nr:DEAD/DEAH box helicase [Aquificota bacterium]
MKKVSGAVGSYPEYYCLKNIEPPFLVITPDQKRAKLFTENITAFAKYFNKSITAVNIPEFRQPLDLDTQIKINYLIYSHLFKKPTVLSTAEIPKGIKVRTKNRFLKDTVQLKAGETTEFEYIMEKLKEGGYTNVDSVEGWGEFTVKGGVITVNIPFLGVVEIHTFGDEIEEIFLKSKLNTRKPIPQVDIFPLYTLPIKGDIFPYTFDETDSVDISEYLQDIKTVYLNTQPQKGAYLHITTQGYNLDIPSKEEAKGYKKVYLPIRTPLQLKSEKTVYLPEDGGSVDIDVETLSIGDYIIHQDYGIGIFKGIETRNIKGKDYDFMVLEYAGGEKIYVSYLHFDKIFKYKAYGSVQLDSLSSPSWRSLKRKVKNSLRKVAKQLIQLYTYRQGIKRKPLSVEDPLIKEMETTFEYVETPDQLKAIKDVKTDLSKETPMERVVCGDVGFGKTEVALRSAFISVLNGYQVAVLTPTTVLALQHYRNFKKRLEPFGVVVENLSRLKSTKEQKEILQKLENGEIDIIIGTHKLLQDKVKFKNLGMLIIDEEHRFGVRAKERIRQKKKDIDTLYLTATPIPRTLNMALSGLKEMSVINTPPEGRMEVKTFVSVYSIETVKGAIQRELERGGQVFYLHNRVSTIKEKAEELKGLFPNRKVLIAHGQMKPKEIEKVVMEFMEGKGDILVATSIIETGVDIPTANTLIVEDAHMFGLAQLYHLRGRVGRGDRQAYCYLFVPPDLTDKAEKRINTIMKLTKPGSGLKVALEDMKIRGAGNILGVEQSGHIKAVGYQMYIKLLQEAINEERGDTTTEATLVVSVDSFIPEEFINNPDERLNIYLSVAKATDIKEIEEIKKHLEEFYQGLPQAFQNYLEIQKLKKAIQNKGIKKLHINSPVSTMEITDQFPVETLQSFIKEFNVPKVEGETLYFPFNQDTLRRLVGFFAD